MEQSPASKRPKAPSQNPATDNPPYHEIGGQTDRQGPKSGSPKVPDLDFGPAKSQGRNTPHSERTSVGKPAPVPMGKAGYVSAPEIRGGTEEQFSSDRGGNS